MRLAPVIIAAFLLSGCAQITPYLDAASAAIEGLGISVKPTPETPPEDDTG